MQDMKDVFDKVIETLQNNMAKTMIDVGIDVIGVSHPLAGAVLGIGNELLIQYNNFKLDYLVKGLSKDLNMESQINELYNFVDSSVENAIIVANVFRKTVNAESPKVCVLYGLVLARHVSDKSGFTNEELIVSRALENATDFDLCTFKTIMEQYVDIDTDQKRRVFFKKGAQDQIETIRSICDWAVFNRILTTNYFLAEHVYDRAKNASEYFVTNEADCLYKLIMDAQQIWDYE